MLKAVQDVRAGGDPSELRDAVLKAVSQGTATSVPGAAALPIPGAPSAPPSDPLDRLEKLNELRLSGALTDAEFEAQKAKLLGEM